jgi:hypothetical protein
MNDSETRQMCVNIRFRTSSTQYFDSMLGFVPFGFLPQPNLRLVTIMLGFVPQPDLLLIIST